MNDSRILSIFHESALTGSQASQSAGGPGSARLFDACHVGVVLRVVLFVEAAVGIGALFVETTWDGWLARMALLTGAALPAALLWLLGVCSLQHVLATRPLTWQWTVGVGLGAVAGAYGCALVAWLGWVQPAPWLASVGAGALVAAVVVAGLVWRMRALTPAGTLAQLAMLQARIRPHFLFNTLNSAIALVRAEPAKAESLLEDLSELFRHALADNQASVPLAQELELARHYLAIEQVRFGPRLRLEWRLDPSADMARLPPLILQPLVENAVKHGVEPSPDGALVRVSTQRRGSVVVVKVTNTVPAGTGVRGHGLALDNVRQRLGLLHDVQGRFQAAWVDGVFQVRLEIPV